jgi:molybdate/tungstate transport system substrate-binding protein
MSLCLSIAFLAGCQQRERTPLKVLFAGSLIRPCAGLEEAYERAHPEVDVQMEGHGSLQVMRHVTEIGDEVDVVMPADHALIPMLMYSATVPETGEPYANWYAQFATNRLALAYRPESRHADQISEHNWYEFITRPGVKLGISDPRFDACGYRALMALQLAEAEYHQPMLFEEVASAGFRLAVRTRGDGESVTIRVPEILETRAGSNLIMRSYSIQLIALLESGDLDYTFAYESVIKQHGLEMVPLPDSLNLGSAAFADHYGKVKVRLDFQRFASIKPEFAGEVIAYAVTIPCNAPHPEEAEEFVAFLLSSEGRAILEQNHQPVLLPITAHSYENVPAGLKRLCVPMP